MNRRNILKSVLALPFVSLLPNKVIAGVNDSLSPMAKEIESHFLESYKIKCDYHNLPFEPYKVVGIWNDDSLHRCRRIGCYWYWEGVDGEDYGCSVDFPKSEIMKKFKLDKVCVAWENAVNEVHNKYTGSNRTEYSQLSKYMDA